MMSPTTNKFDEFRIGIIGSGFAALSLANYLERHASSKSLQSSSAFSSISYQLFESKPQPIPIIGTIQLPFARELLESLDLLQDSKASSVFPLCDNNDFVTVSRETFLNVLRQQVDIEYECQVVDVVEKGDDKSSNKFIITQDGGELGPFDLVVVADGLFGTASSLKTNQNISARIGDCRWYSERLVWWDFGTKRIQKGADIAIRDGLELGKRLVKIVESCGDDDRRSLLGEFAMPSPDDLSRRKRQWALFITLFMPLLLHILYHTIQNFERI